MRVVVILNEIIEFLAQKHHISPRTNVHLKDNEGEISGPFSLEEFALSLAEEQWHPEWQILVEGETEWISLIQHPFFYDFALEILNEEILPQTRQEEITSILHKAPISEPTQLYAPEDEKTRWSEEMVKKQIFHPFSHFRPWPHGGAFALLVFLSLITFYLFLSRERDKAVTPEFVEMMEVILPPEKVKQTNDLLSQQHFQNGRKFFLQDTWLTYQKAIQEFHTSLEYQPNNYLSLAALADAYANLWEMSRQDKDYVKGIERLTQRSLAVQLNQAASYRALSEISRRLGQSDKARDMAQKALQEKPLDPESSFLLAAAYFDMGDSEQTEKFLTQALEVDPSLIRAHYYLGLLLEKRNEPEKAYETYRNGLYQHPQHSLSRLRMAHIALEFLHNRDLAKENVLTLISFPKFLPPKKIAEARQFLGKIYESENNLDLARVQYYRALKLAPQEESYSADFERLGGIKILKELPSEETVSEESAYFMVQGDKFRAQEQFLDAVVQYQLAFQLDPKNAQAPLRVGEMYQKLFKYDQAREAFEKALEVKKDSLDAYVKLTDVALEQYDFSKVDQLLERMATLFPASAQLFQLQGDYELRKGNKEKALRYYVRSANNAPQNPDNMLKLANLYLDVGALPEARQLYKKIVEQAPELTEVQIKVAELYFKQGFKGEALHHLRILIERDPLNPHYHLGLAKIYALAGETKLAKEEALQSLKLAPRNPQALIFLSDLHKEEGNISLAAQTLEDLARVLPASGDPLFQKTELWMEQGYLTAALEDLSRLLNRWPRYPKAQLLAGEIYEKMGNVDKAMEAYQKETDYHPDQYLPFLKLARLEIEKGIYAQALQHLEQARNRETKDENIFFLMGIAHLKLGNWEHAIAFFKSSLDRNPNLAEAHLWLGYLYKERDQRASAREAFQTYLQLSPRSPNADDIKREIEDLGTPPEEE